jgi:hypothetical protein
MTGIGSVVTRDLKSHGLYFGNPTRQKGWIDEQGEKLNFDSEKNVWIGKDDSVYQEQTNGLIKIK